METGRSGTHPDTEATLMAEWFVTFGQRYRTETHPVFADAHPDGWVTIVADSEEQARRVAFGLLGRQWAFLYPSTYTELDQGLRPGRKWAELFPRGELARIVAE